MRNDPYFDSAANQLGMRLAATNLNVPRRTAIGVIMMVALLAFEIFNFDTTQYALRNLLGEVQFLGLQWASILAIAFCSIDFAGLIRLFTPERGDDEPREVWYLMGAWLLGATMNAAMTWWAVSLTLLNHDFGNEVLSREQLLRYVPIFVAVLVWLTRILFIGSFTIAGDHIFDIGSLRKGKGSDAPPRQVPARTPKRAAASQVNQEQPTAVHPRPAMASNQPARSNPPRPSSSRIRRRPPMPNGGTRRAPSSIQARPRDGR